MANGRKANAAAFVRFSRDGDQFHYFWAARRCLKLLSPASDLVTLTIEAASPIDAGRLIGVDGGTEVIDVAEYYGGEDPATARLLRYVQLKHSTLRADQPWTPSDLKKTLAGFAKRYAALSATFSARNTEDQVEFCFVSNRPVDVGLMEAIADAAAGGTPRHPKLLAKLRTFTRLKQPRLGAFCKRVRILDKEENYSAQRFRLTEDIRGYLPGDDADAPVQLKELVTRKATSDFATNPAIRKMDVLRALGVTEVSLFPAHPDSNRRPTQSPDSRSVISLRRSSRVAASSSFMPPAALENQFLRRG